MSTAPGCLLFALPRRLMGRSPVAALPDGLALPVLDTATVDPLDLPAAIRARNAARACRERLLRAGLSPLVTRDAGGELVGFVERVYAIAAELKRARAFVITHGADEVARRRADLELELIGASPAAIPGLKSALKALDQRGRHASVVQGEIERLVARLQAAVAELEALQAKLEAPDAEALIHEVRAWHQSAKLALDAFVQTVGEL